MKTKLTKSVVDLTAFEKYSSQNEVVTLPGTGAVTMDMTTAPIFKMNLTGNVTLTIAPKFPPVLNESFSYLQTLVFIKQDSVGGRVVTWPNSCVWTTATAPAMGPAANKLDVVEMITFDAGFTWYCKKLT
jgi:hypothetical protein